MRFRLALLLATAVVLVALVFLVLDWLWLDVPGVVRASEVRVNSPVSGRVESLLLAELTRVTPGALAAQLADERLASEILALRRAVEVLDTEAQERRDVGIKATEQAMATARELRAAVQEQIRVKTAEIEVLEREQRRFQTLADEGSDASYSQADKALADLLRARSDLAALRRDESEQERRLAELVVELERWQSGSDAAILQVVSDAEAFRSRLRELEARESALTVRVPVEGVVSEVFFRPGEIVPAGAAIAVVSDLSRLWIQAFLDAEDWNDLYVGRPVRVKLPPPRGEWVGGRIQSAREVVGDLPPPLRDERAQRRATVPVRIELDDPADYAGVKMGQDVRIRLDRIH